MCCHNIKNGFGAEIGMSLLTSLSYFTLRGESVTYCHNARSVGSGVWDWRYEEYQHDKKLSLRVRKYSKCRGLWVKPKTCDIRDEF